jgi:zinc transport system ATP-binding protein
MNKPAVKVNNISFGYHTNSDVLENISFTIPVGSTTMLIGPNGSGKTTLLKIMVGLLEPTQGRVRIFGNMPKDARNNIGYVPQRLHVDASFPITVMEFLQFSDKDVSVSDITKVLEGLGVSELACSVLGKLSGGQLQRVLIARSLLHNPKILFLDEPVSGIDIGGEHSFYELIKEIQKERDITVVMVSHEVHLVSRVADQVICVNKEMLCSGTPSEALLPEVIEKLYGKDVSLYEHHC